METKRHEPKSRADDVRRWDHFDPHCAHLEEMGGRDRRERERRKKEKRKEKQKREVREKKRGER